MSYDILRPFGPTIYKSKLTPSELRMFQDCALLSAQRKQPKGHELAGNIAEQYQGVFSDDSKVEFLEFVHNHVKNFMSEELKRQKQYVINPMDDDVDWTTLRFHLANGPWINYQKANEFNPAHSHNGILSAVVYIDVPEEIAEEANDGLLTSMRCPGQIEFLYASDALGSSGTHKIIPQTGDVLLFHAGLKHTVYPFKSDVTRVSMSFNVFDISYGKEANNE